MCTAQIHCAEPIFFLPWHGGQESVIQEMCICTEAKRLFQLQKGHALDPGRVLCYSTSKARLSGRVRPKPEFLTLFILYKPFFPSSLMLLLNLCNLCRVRFSSSHDQQSLSVFLLLEYAAWMVTDRSWTGYAGRSAFPSRMLLWAGQIQRFLTVSSDIHIEIKFLNI